MGGVPEQEMMDQLNCAVSGLLVQNCVYIGSVAEAGNRGV